MRNVSLKHLIIYYTLFIFFIPILTIGVGAVGTIFYTSKQSLVNNNALLLENVTESMRNRIKQSVRELEILEFFIKNENVLNNKNVNNLVNSILFDKDFFESICIYNDKGEIQSSSPIKKGLFNFDTKSVLDKKNITFLTKNLGENGHNFKLAIYYPILKDDLFLGFILGAINFNCIESVLQTYRDKKKRINILVFDGEENLLFNGEKEKRINAFDIVNYDNDNVLNFNIVNIEGKKNIVFFEHIKEVDWNVALVSELSYAFKVAIFLRSVVIVYFVLGILTTIFTMFLGYFFIFRPLVELSYQTARIAHGDYDFQFKDNLIKELNMLTQNFKRMREKIIKKETELTNSELKYRKLIEDSLDFFFKVSNKMKFTFISPSIEKTLGYTAEEFLAGFRKHLRYSKQNLEIIGISRRVFKNMEIPEPFIFEIENKFGKPVVMEIQLTPVVFNNEVAELQGSARDITLRYNVEKEISYLKNYLYSIIESMPSSVITMNRDGSINQFNSAAKKMFDNQDGNLKGKILWEISDKFSGYEKYFTEALKKNELLEFREEVKINNKDIRYYNISFFPLNIMQEKEMVLRIDDVTKIEKVEMQLRQAQKLEIIGTMAGGLAHDFNNILGAILGTLTLIEFRTKNKKMINYNTLQDDLKTIKDASSKATAIIQQLMTLSRKQTLKMETIDLNEEIKQVVNICKNSFGKQLKIDVKPYKEAAWIEANSGQIEQMLLNLIVNAKDVIKDDGLIQIVLDKMSSDITIQKNSHPRHGQTFWNLKIIDNGFGIPEEYKEHIFDPFFTTKEKGRGTGLGLTMVYNIIKQHKGFIDFDSEIGAGTTFNIYLPIKNISTVNKKVEINKPQIFRGEGLVLVVDDDEYIRYTASEILKECGYDVLKAKDGEEGALLYKENHKNIKAVLLDMVMPNKTGKEAYIEMKKVDKNVKVLLCSAVKTDPRIAETMALGVKKFLLKPYSFEELSEAMYNLVYNISQE